jgi:hypothetical protein
LEYLPAVFTGRTSWASSTSRTSPSPAGVSVFAHELDQAPRSWAERAYPKLIYFNQLDRGNHFAAWQEPALFAAEVRAAFRSPR